MKRLISFYFMSAKTVGMIIFAYCGNVVSNFDKINILYRIRNIVSYGLIGYFISPYIIPIYYIQSLYNSYYK